MGFIKFTVGKRIKWRGFKNRRPAIALIILFKKKGYDNIKLLYTLLFRNVFKNRFFFSSG